MAKLFGNKEEVLQARLNEERNEFANNQETRNILQGYELRKHEIVKTVPDPDRDGCYITTTTTALPATHDLRERISKIDSSGNEYYNLFSEQRNGEDGVKLYPSVKKETIGGSPLSEQTTTIYQYDIDDDYCDDEDEDCDHSDAIEHLCNIHKIVETTENRTDGVTFKTTVDSDLYPEEEDEEKSKTDAVYDSMVHKARDTYSFEEIRMFKSDGRTLRTRFPSDLRFDACGNVTSNLIKYDDEFNRTVKYIRNNTRYSGVVNTFIKVDGPEYKFSTSLTTGTPTIDHTDTYVVDHPVFKGKHLAEIEYRLGFRTVRTYDYEYVNTSFGKALRTTMIEVRDNTESINACICRQADTFETVPIEELKQFAYNPITCDKMHRYKTITFDIVDGKFEGSTFSFSIFNEEFIPNIPNNGDSRLVKRQCVTKIVVKQFTIKEKVTDSETYEYRYDNTSDISDNREFGVNDNVNEILMNIVESTFERFTAPSSDLYPSQIHIHSTNDQGSSDCKVYVRYIRK